MSGIVQFIKFSIVGTMNTIVDLGVYYLCIHAFSWHYQVGNILGFIISVTNAYYWSNRFVFAEGRKHTYKEHIERYLKTISGYGVTCLLGILLLWVWVEKVSISENFAKIINLFITVPLNYLIVKYWSFGKCKKSTEIPQNKKEI